MFITACRTPNSPCTPEPCKAEARVGFNLRSNRRSLGQTRRRTDRSVLSEGRLLKADLPVPIAWYTCQCSPHVIIRLPGCWYTYTYTLRLSKDLSTCYLDHNEQKIAPANVLLHHTGYHRGYNTMMRS